MTGVPPHIKKPMAKLTFVLEDGEEVVVPILERITVGRAEDNDVMVDDERLAPCHAELLLNADGSVQVFDQNTPAGTFVNGTRIVSQTLLHGDRLAFGPLEAVLDLEHPANTPGTSPFPGTPAVPEEKRDDSDLHAAREELRALREKAAALRAAEKDAEKAHRHWLAAIESLRRQHEQQTAALREVEQRTDEAQARLDALTERENTQTRRLRRLQEELDAENRRLDEARQKGADIQQAESALVALQQRHAALEAQVRELEAVEGRLPAATTALSELEARQQKLRGIVSGAEAEHQRQQDALARLQNDITAAEERLRTLRGTCEEETRQLEAARARKAEMEAHLAAPRLEIERQIEHARQELAELRARLRPLRDWKDDMDRRGARLAALPPGCPEAQEIQEQTDAALADLPRLLPALPSRNPHTIQVEAMSLRRVPMKSESVRRAHDRT